MGQAAVAGCTGSRPKEEKRGKKKAHKTPASTKSHTAALSGLGKSSKPPIEHALLQKTFDEKALATEPLLLDQCDLETTWPKTLEGFVYCDVKDVSQVCRIAVSKEGAELLGALGNSDNAIYNLQVPATAKLVCHDSDDPSFLMRIFTPDAPALAPVVRFGDGIDDILDEITEVCSTGAETIHVTVFRSMVEASFEKADVVEKQEMETKEELASDTKVLTSLWWGSVRHFTLTSMTETPYKDNSGKILKTTQYLRDKAAETDTREFRLESYKDLLTDKEGGVKTVPLTHPCQPVPGGEKDDSEGPAKPSASKKAAEKGQLLKDAIDQMVVLLGDAAADIDTWTATMAWSPMKVAGMPACINEAKACLLQDDDDGHLREVLRAVDILNGVVHRVRGGRKKKVTLKPEEFNHKPTHEETLLVSALPKMEDRDTSMIFRGLKSFLDRMLTAKEEGTLDESRFEEQLQDICEKSVGIIDDVFMPLAKVHHSPVHIALYLREKGDYMRYRYVYISNTRQEPGIVNAIHTVYNLACEASMVVARHDPQNFVVSGAHANAAVFQIEVMRSNHAAADICQRMLTNFESHMAAEKEAKSTSTKSTKDPVLGTAQIFNWNLVEQNLKVFETQLMLCVVSFDTESFKRHAEQVPAEDVLPPEDRKTVADLGKSSGEGDVSHPEDPTGAHCSAMCVARAGCFAKKTDKGSSEVGGIPRLHSVHVPEDESKRPEAAAIARWLRSQPVKICGHQWALQGAADEKKNDMTVLFRWIANGEILEGDSHLGGDSEAPVDEKASDKFLVGLACQLKPGAIDAKPEDAKPPPLYPFFYDNMAHDRDGEALIKELRDCIRGKVLEWPSKEARKPDLEVKVNLDTEHKLQALVALLNEDGVLMEPPPAVLKMSGLVEGDVLIKWPDGETVENLRKQKDKEREKPTSVPCELFFMPALKALSFEVADQGAYGDVHEYFEGFQNQAVITLVDPQSTLHSTSQEFKRAREDAGADGMRQPPNRVAGLSARRDPIAAVTRGPK